MISSPASHRLGPVEMERDRRLGTSLTSVPSRPIRVRNGRRRLVRNAEQRPTPPIERAIKCWSDGQPKNGRREGKESSIGHFCHKISCAHSPSRRGKNGIVRVCALCCIAERRKGKRGRQGQWVAAAAAQSGDAIILVHGKKLLWPADRVDKRIHRHRPRHYASDIGHTSIGWWQIKWRPIRPLRGASPADGPSGRGATIKLATRAEKMEKKTRMSSIMIHVSTNTRRAPWRHPTQFDSTPTFLFSFFLFLQKIKIKIKIFM